MNFVITGGCGFIGTNFAINLLNSGHNVTIIDDFSRPGSLVNREYLESNYVNNLTIISLDISKPSNLLIHHISNSHHVFHLAAQVAVTTSILNPVRDFEVNVLGTLNLLEIIRVHSPNTTLIYSSTNKVYGEIFDEVLELEKKYVSSLYPNGIDESVQLSFHSPYGCSKGAADQYVIDYAKVFGIKSVVFRQSCIYGNRQYGTEDQGWASWFITKGLRNQPITIYGTGKQVRDMLHVDDLFSAWMLAIDNVESFSGNAFNIGGGIINSISLLEFLDYTSSLGLSIDYSFGIKRTGDQDVFISDNSKFMNLSGWTPLIDCRSGIKSMLLHLEKTKNDEN